MKMRVLAGVLVVWSVAASGQPSGHVGNDSKVERSSASQVTSSKTYCEMPSDPNAKNEEVKQLVLKACSAEKAGDTETASALLSAAFHLSPSDESMLLELRRLNCCRLE